MKSTIRYLGYMSRSPHRTASFYMKHLGMKELGRSPVGDISVTDGWFNLTFLLARPDLPPPGAGVVGIAVDDIQKLRDNLETHNPEIKLEKAPGGLHHGDYRLIATNGHPVVVSTTNFGMPAEDKSSLPAIKHAAICGPRVPDLSAFFMSVFELEKSAPQMWRWEGNFVSDGITELALLANADVLREHDAEITPDHVKEGLNHFGFEPGDVEKVVAGLPFEAGATLRSDRPKPDGYYRVWDPDGNHFDIRQTGWQSLSNPPK